MSPSDAQAVVLAWLWILAMHGPLSIAVVAVPFMILWDLVHPQQGE